MFGKVTPLENICPADAALIRTLAILLSEFCQPANVVEFARTEEVVAGVAGFVIAKGGSFFSITEEQMIEAFEMPETEEIWLALHQLNKWYDENYDWLKNQKDVERTVSEGCRLIKGKDVALYIHRIPEEKFSDVELKTVRNFARVQAGYAPEDKDYFTSCPARANSDLIHEVSSTIFTASDGTCLMYTQQQVARALCSDF